MQMEEDFVWIQTTWCKASHAQQKHGENLLLTAYSARGQLMCHEDASSDAHLMKTVLVLLGHLMLQHKVL
jgi:hypothetical protein